MNRLNYLTKIIKNSFYIDFCIEETVRLYIRVFRESDRQKQLNRQYNKTLMQYCIYTLNHWYSFKPPATHHFEKIKKAFSQEDIALIEHQASSIRALCEEEDKILCSHDNQRWKRVYEHTVSSFNENEPQLIYEKINQLASFNREIRLMDTRNIYHKGYLFMADKHKEISLKLYLQYLNVKSHSNTFEHKTISKRNMTRLFANEKQKTQFEQICKQLQKDNDIRKALETVTELYTVKRKKIELNIEAIQDAKAKQNDVARLLGEYLNDEEVGYDEQIHKIDAVTKKTESVENNQKALFDLFISNSFRLNQQEVHIFAQTRGLFKDQFIESINDQYYEELDDLLIEEEENDYMLNQEYYNKVVICKEKDER